MPYSDALVQLCLLFVILIGIERVQTNVMIQQLSTNTVLEVQSLVEGEWVSLGDDGNDVDNFGKALHHDDVDRAKRVTGRVDEEQAAMNTRVLDVSVTLSGQLFSEVRWVLVLGNNVRRIQLD